MMDVGIALDSGAFKFYNDTLRKGETGSIKGALKELFELLLEEDGAVPTDELADRLNWTTNAVTERSRQLRRLGFATGGWQGDVFTHRARREKLQELSTASMVQRRREMDYSDYLSTPAFVRYLDRYVEFLYEIGANETLTFYAVLDVIGSPKYTWDMQVYMESCGLSPMPIFHVNPDITWLKKLMDRYSYIGIGGVGKEVTKRRFLSFGDQVFRYAYGPSFDAFGDSPVRFHGYAMTTGELLTRYPWFSVDSSTWTTNSRNGTVLVPRSNGILGKDLEFDYLDIPGAVRFFKGASHAWCYYKRIGEHATAILNTYLEDVYVGDPPSFSAFENGYVEFDRCNVYYMLRVESQMRRLYQEKFGRNGWGLLYLSGKAANGTSNVRQLHASMDVPVHSAGEGFRYLGTFANRADILRFLEYKEDLVNED